jgi:molecular chaperone HtpG
MEAEYVFGKNIIENLTIGMYRDSKIMYREYIQNSCDQIDKAIQSGLLSKEEAKIEIWLDSDKREVIIQDNATGIPSKDFKRILGNIADSDKEQGKDKGFRGIGRLCGLAYCKKLIFVSKSKSEQIESIMEVDAKKMKDILESNEKMPAQELLDSINQFKENKIENIDEHYFIVKLIGINDENDDLLDKQKIIDYLSFVAPVPYQNIFTFKAKIYKYATDNNFKIDEYNIIIEGEQILKKYSVNFSDDKIFDIEFKKFEDYNGNAIAWMWYGLTSFKKALTEETPMRRIRLRKENIQIGNDATLQKLFKESRGQDYFIGEVFAISKELKPNAQRDYFNESMARRDFEGEIKRYFEDIAKVYRTGSELNSVYKNIEEVFKLQEEFKEKTFDTDDHKAQSRQEIEIAKEKAEKAKLKLEKMKENSSSVIQRVVKEREKQHNVENTDEIKISPINNKKNLIDKIKNISKPQKQLLDKIFNIIRKNVKDRDVADKIVQEIYQEFK